MKRTNLYVVWLAVPTIFLLSEEASAQDYSFYNKMFSNMLSNRIWDSIYQQSSPGYAEAKKKLMASQSRSSSQASSVPTYRRYPAVQFKSTGTKLTVKEAAELLDPVPADRPETEKILSGILDKYEVAAREKSYPNDLALALVSYISLNGRVYHGNREKPIIPFEQNVGLRDVLAEQVTEKGTFKNLTDRQKQELYETLVMFGGVTYDMYEKAVRENNSEGIETWKQFAEQNLKAVGIKP